MRNAVLLLLLAFFMANQANADIILARAPQLSASILAETWTPYVNYLSEKTGETIKLKLYSDRSQFESDIVKGRVDLYYANPAYGVIGKLSKNYMPLVRGDKKRLKGIIVVKKDSEINSVQDLKNKVIVFPGETAFAASLYIQDQLDNVVKIPYKARFLDTHNNAYRSVLTGKYIASGGVFRTLEREPGPIREKLKIIYETPGVKPHVLMAHPGLSNRIKNRIVEATLALDATEQGKKMLKTLKLVKPVKADYEQDYKKLEKLATKIYGHLL